jgi:hypothetical protein
VQFDAFSFGSVRIDGVTYSHDVVMDRGEIRKRTKKPSGKFRDDFGHTPLSIDDAIPWKCRMLVIGTGTAAMPLMDEVKHEAERREIKLLILPTQEAIEASASKPHHRNRARNVLREGVRPFHEV